ncbi:hypothetical protein A2334_01425 [Candidatus Roizmanbacteria bacterium RIFOXYB2_FULL_38_10]|uniref:Cohesin domain-containing protein n=1 Tax=Candidatus Roizmanbacteria bacterium RIFOXYD1_FULL_38_12 TaxID=1802093 RepID=A0A1F7L271_9BACT|nr:MAG: hypothetical protein A3K47_05635 [Candidatus Roizmanbacteria bacterium RIFOXYA2_FULL_38_14]OGK64225.1 MAG: hypothetical protein A3K27_05635 [Candidatus Roizmanbacteria bacterium RIFOXYA1_FULL_37_12]OGK66071.1 MAG: hypothetical protein A3K38_05635 [Candidatus Roizmanbacteria bacterium RIFOXYB1_FULL_40_23]OGK68510.1 MAG: hypothetical protein A2334_01425 [Candidatus Roizmanbacteria bacterium RIFOXYB2_FULL_38_10]OGK70476.1 MAG: hypothetical protein A3K21_05640 [Candidatus Roizmanbacteria ba
MVKKLGVSLFFIIAFFVSAPSAFAVRFELVPPSGELSRGQEVTFTVNMDTQGATINTIQTGMTYDTQFLEYVSSAPGAAMNSVTVDTSQGTGKLLFTGTNTAGFTGTGIYATVVFKIIAAESGSTELCTLWTPTPSPTPVPVCNNTCTSSSECPSGLYCYIASGQTSGYCRAQTCPEEVSCVCPVAPTSPPPPPPTALPQSGFDIPKNIGSIAGGLFLLTAAAVLIYSKKNTYFTHKKTHGKHPHHS